MLSTRPATIADAALLRTMICELAEFERGLEWVKITEEDLARDGFGPKPIFQALIGEWKGQPVAYALFFDYYSTWRGKQMFLEDLFVRPQFRGLGIGKAMLAAVAQIAIQENCRGMRWEVLDWNQPAIDFYKSLGADFMDEWKLVMLNPEDMNRLAEIAP